jgi:hypothetical protein
VALTASLKVLFDRTKTVISDEITDHNNHHSRVELMQNCVRRFQKVFVEDLEKCCGLVTVDKDDPTITNPVNELPGRRSSYILSTLSTSRR